MKYTVAQISKIMGREFKTRLMVIEAPSREVASKLYNEAYEKAFPRSPMIGKLNLVVEEYRW